MLVLPLLSALALHATAVTASAVQSKETLTFVMMTKTTGFHTRRYTNALRNKAKQLNKLTTMAWHSHYQLHTQYALPQSSSRVISVLPLMGFEVPSHRKLALRCGAVRFRVAWRRAAPYSHWMR